MKKVNSMPEFKIVSFYRFVSIKNKVKMKKLLDNYIYDKNIKGTILLSNEGINASLAGKENEVFAVLKYIKKYLNIRKLNLKINNSDYVPFNRMKVRLKKEIVSLGQGHINIKKMTGKFVEAEKWDSLISKENIKIIDVRNPYEINVGKFKKSINPSTRNFRQFPSEFQKMKLKKSDKIAMYCTGGIRCEKASAYIKKLGYKKVFQLRGGILNYLDHYKNKKGNGMWKGECFVFDNRVTVNKKLSKGKYSQCYGCRSPISEDDMKSEFYIKGVTCPYCYSIRTEEQKKRSSSRQKQINGSILKF